MKFLKNINPLMLTAAMSMAAVGAWADGTKYEIAHWSFNYKYTVADGIGTPSSTAQTSNDNVNLHDVKLVPNDALVDGAYLTPHRPTLATDANQVDAQDNKGAYLEVNAISCDGAAIHLTSPVPTPETASTSFTYKETTTAFPDGNSYSYQNPYNYYEIEVPAADYKNLEIEIKAAGHNSSEQYYAVAYSTDKSTWTIVGDTYLTGASYNRWVVTTVDLSAMGQPETAYIRLFPAKNWKGSGSSVNSDNQFNLDDVYIRGELAKDLAEISDIKVNGEAVTEVEGESYDYDFLLPADYSGTSVTIAPTVSNATVKLYVEDEEGDTQSYTDNGDGTYTIATPPSNSYYMLTFKITANEGATAMVSEYKVRVFFLSTIKLSALSVDGTSIDKTLLATLNDNGEATLTGSIFTKMPVIDTKVIDGSEANVSSSLNGNTATYVITARDSVFTFNVDGVHVYEMGENDETVEITYSSDGKSAYVAEGNWTDGWTNGSYTLRTTKLDGWGGSQFKFNGTDFQFEVPGGVVIKSFAFAKFGANYGDGEGITAFASDGATCWIPTDHDYTRGAKDTVIVVLDNHQPGTPVTFTITGGSQPYAQFSLIIEKTNPGTAPTARDTSVTVVNNHAMIGLTFDREMAAADVDFNGTTIHALAGPTLTFGLTGLEYEKDYTFTIPAGKLTDNFGNVNAEDIVINFTVGAQQAVEKKAYDYIVGTSDEFTAALSEIGNSTKTGLDRVVIFMKNGDYDFGEDNEQRIYRGNVSLVGQSRDSVILHGTRTGISNPILNIRDREGFYLQDFTVRNDLDFGTTRKGVGVAIYGGNKSIMKNICMQSQQDTQVTGERSYYDSCQIHGTVDFICGGGNHFYDKCNIVLEGSGSVIAAPATTKSCLYGYVFSHCTINSADGLNLSDGYYDLARPWQNEPRTNFVYTTMNVLPTNLGYRGMSNLPTHFYEYGSVDKDGNTIDLSVRGNSSTSTNTYVPILSQEEADAMTVMAVLAETDGWLPTDYTVLTAVPEITVTDGTMSWEDDDQVRCYVIFKDNEYVTDITETSYTPEESGTYTLRTANSMGGLSKEEKTVTITTTGINEISEGKIADNETYNLNGQKVSKSYKGILVKKGKKVIR